MTYSSARIHFSIWTPMVVVEEAKVPSAKTVYIAQQSLKSQYFTAAPTFWGRRNNVKLENLSWIIFLKVRLEHFAVEAEDQ